MPDSLLPAERQAIISQLQKMRDVYSSSHPNVAEWASERMEDLQDEALRQSRETDQLELDMYGYADPADDELGQMLEGDDGETDA